MSGKRKPRPAFTRENAHHQVELDGRRSVSNALRRAQDNSDLSFEELGKCDENQVVRERIGIGDDLGKLIARSGIKRSFWSDHWHPIVMAPNDVLVHGRVPSAVFRDEVAQPRAVQ